jgi:hypothetical protein
MALFLLSSITAAAQTATDQPLGGLASRIQKNEDDANTLIIENKITTSFTIPEITLIPCQATVSLGYYQRNTLARVETSIENNSCLAGSGSLEISATIRDENGNTSTLAFPEQWQQNGDTKMEFVRDYPIGENVELLRVRSSKIKCDCSQSITQ